METLQNIRTSVISYHVFDYHDSFRGATNIRGALSVDTLQLYNVSK